MASFYEMISLIHHRLKLLTLNQQKLRIENQEDLILYYIHL
jgi:hypothetical protein